MRLRHRRAPRMQGFSLLEVLAAFVILAVLGTTLFRLFSGALQNAAASEDWSRALLVAESRLTAAANAVPLVEATDQGAEDDGRIRWQTRVLAYEPAEVDVDLARVSDTMSTRLYRVEVDVRFPGLATAERSLSLATVRLSGKLPQ